MDDAAFEAQVILFLHALLEGRRLAHLEGEARAAFADVVAGRVPARGGDGLRALIPEDSRFWEVATASRDEFRRGLAAVRAGEPALRAETATLRTAMAALLELANAGDVYAELDAALP